MGEEGFFSGGEVLEEREGERRRFTGCGKLRLKLLSTGNIFSPFL